MHIIERRAAATQPGAQPSPQLSLHLSGEQCALIIEGLAEKPFKLVFELIGELHRGSGAAAGGWVTLHPAQLRLILDTLGGMPFARVSALLQSMHQQMRAHQQGLRDD
jgi:hypothetical protein